MRIGFPLPRVLSFIAIAQLSFLHASCEWQEVPAVRHREEVATEQPQPGDLDPRKIIWAADGGTPPPFESILECDEPEHDLGTFYEPNAPPYFVHYFAVRNVTDKRIHVRYTRACACVPGPPVGFVFEPRQALQIPVIARTSRLRHRFRGSVRLRLLFISEP